MGAERVRTACAVGVLAVAIVTVVMQSSNAAQNVRGEDSNLTYDSGQSVLPMYHGWFKNADGSFDLHFGYLNRNWRERLNIPIGPDNNISGAPNGPDGGQPTHFLPRVNRWQFKVRVPADFGDKELVWTLTSHGETYRTYATLKPGYVQDENGLQREFYGDPPKGNKWPEVRLEGSAQRTATVGQPVTLVAVVVDDGLPEPRQAVRQNQNTRVPGVPVVPPGLETVGAVGGTTTRQPARGLRFAWYPYRGAADVVFTPPQLETWEDQRTGRNNPSSPGWKTPPTPPGGRYEVQATFRNAGTFVLRGLAHDGVAWGSQDVTFVVTP